MKLTDTAVRNAQPGEKRRKIFDGGGLYLYLSTTGHRSWRFKYRFAGKEKHLLFGRYPEISVKMARDMLLQARRALELGIDPGAQQELERVARSATFEAVAYEWIAIQRSELAPKTFECKCERFRALRFSVHRTMTHYDDQGAGRPRRAPTHRRARPQPRGDQRIWRYRDPGH
jgi:hypothetical protein